MAYKRCYMTGNGEYLNSYKKLVKVSDMCQLLDKSKFSATQTINGVTFTNNGDGTITVNGTSTSIISVKISSLNIIKNNRYLLTGCPTAGSDGSGNWFYRLRCFSGIGDEYGDGKISYANETGLTSLYIQINTTTTVSNLVFKPQLFDLTEMFGAGHEPTTVEAFKALYPLSYYPYQPYCFAPVKSSNYIGKTKNLISIKSTTQSKIKIYANNTICIMRNYGTNLNVGGLLETFKSLTPGKTYTISRKSAGIATGFVSGTIALHTPSLPSPFKVLIDYNLDSSAQFSLTQEEIDATTGVYGWGNPNHDFYLCNIQLEEGDTATPFTMPNFV